MTNHLTLQGEFVNISKIGSYFLFINFKTVFEEFEKF